MDNSLKWVLVIVEVRWGISIENLTFFFNLKSGRYYSHTNFCNFAMTLNLQDDHFTAGACATCGWLRLSWRLKEPDAVPCYVYPSTWSCPAKSLLTTRHSTSSTKCTKRTEHFYFQFESKPASNKMVRWLPAGWVFAFLALGTLTEASHFRHGSIMWAPDDSNSNTV